MNKKVIGFLLAIPALMGFGLTSCSDEGSIAVNDATEKVVDVKLTASIADQTRATLDPDKNVIKFGWEMGDEIQVVNAGTGKYLGKLTVSKVKNDPRVCEFAGRVAVPAGKVTLNFFYLGKDKKATYGDGLSLKDYTVNFSNQNGEANFADNDVLISTGEYENAQDGNLGMVNFDRNFAYGRFILKYNKEDVDLAGKTVTICANTGKLYNKATLNFQTATYTYEEGTIAVTPAQNDFYVSFFASDAVNLKFVVNEFDGTKGESLIADTYYTADTDGEPIVVEMRHSDGSDDLHQFKLTYDANYAGTTDSKDYTWKAVSPYAYTVKGYDLFAREGYAITSWNTAADGRGDSYEAGSNFTMTAPTLEATLYAQWTKTVYDYTLNWKTRDGDLYTMETLQSDVDPYNWTLVAPDGVNPTVPEGYELAGWAEKAVDPNKVVEAVTFTKNKTVIDVVPVFVEKEYTYTLIFEYISTADNATYVELGRKEIKGLDNLTVTLSQYDSESKAKFPYKDNWIGWAIKDGKISEIPTVTFGKDNTTITVVAMTKWDIKFVDELDPSHVYQPYPRYNYLYTWNFKNQFPANPEKAGYEFLGWYYNDQKVTSPNQIVLTRDNFEPRVIAKWKKKDSSGTIVAPDAGGSDY